MEFDSSSDERELRAARNQAMFRSVNEQLTELNEAFEQVIGTHAIACECADPRCMEVLHVASEEYEKVRSDPRHFVVLPGHVYPEVEQVIAELGRYVVVEKIGAAAEFVAETDPR